MSNNTQKSGASPIFGLILLIIAALVMKTWIAPKKSTPEELATKLLRQQEDDRREGERRKRFLKELLQPKPSIFKGTIPAPMVLPKSPARP